MDEPLRVAVIGAGRMGGLHARVCHQSPDIKLVAVIDADGARAAEVAAKYGVPGATALGERTDEIDAAIVAVPTVSHVAVARPLLERAISCLIEKPLALTVEDAAELVAAAERGGAVLQVGHSERFNPAFMALARYDLKPRFIETERISPCRFRSMDVGVVMDMMIHDIDLVLSLVRSDVAGVDAVGVSIIGATEDMANVRVRFANGCVADFTASRAALKVERRIRVFADSGYVAVDFGAKRGVLIRPGQKLAALRRTVAASGGFESALAGGETFEQMLDVERIEINDHDALTRQLSAFVGAVRGQGPVVVSGRDGQKAVDLAQRIVAAIAEQQREWSAK